MSSEETIPEAAGKGKTRTPDASSPEESDGDVVPRKSANNRKKFPAEWMEERSPTERNDAERSATRTLSRIGCVRRFRQRASERAVLLDVGAVCGSAARTDLRGGRLATAVPTATLIFVATSAAARASSELKEKMPVRGS